MTTVAASTLKPFVDYLTKLYYDNLLAVSWISGIDYQLLYSIANEEKDEVEPQQAQKVVDFLLAHKQRPSQSLLNSYEEHDIVPRFLTPKAAQDREQEIRTIRKEQRRVGY